MNTRSKVLIALAMVAALCVTARALIRADFTPLDLVKQSDVILLLEFKSVSGEGLAVAGVTKVLKGDFADKEVKIDLMAGAFPDQGKSVTDTINGGQKQALMFIGSFSDEEGGQGGGPQGPGGPQQKAYLHLASLYSSAWQWVVLSKFQECWDMEKQDAHLLGTWNGGTDMLLRAVNYILKDPDATVPVNEGTVWDKEIEVAKIEGKVFAAAPVDLAGDGKTGLFVADEKGDRIYQFNGTGFDDVTGKRALKSTSQVFAWGDFDGNGRVDLVSWDGKGLSLSKQQADGTFAAPAPLGVGEALKDGCVDLTTVDTAGKGRPALVVGTKAAPVLLVIQDDGSVQSKSLATGEWPAKDFGEAGRVFAADLDGDAVVDVLQLFAHAGLFYKGKAPGEFAAPAPTQIMAGKGRYGACLGDYDGDGLLDIVVAGDERNFLWHNLGGGKFVDTLDISGEIGYHPKPGGISTWTGDFNNDGRQDILIVYGSQIYPQLFFNRGFRSFGQAWMMDLAELKLLPDAGQGQQAGCLGDFNGDGALDMALVLADGKAWVLPRKVDGGKALAAVVALSPASPTAGPVNVCAWKDARELGAWPIRAGEPGALIGAREAGPITLKWQLPGGKMQQREVILEEGPARVVLDKK